MIKAVNRILFFLVLNSTLVLYAMQNQPPSLDIWQLAAHGNQEQIELILAEARAAANLLNNNGETPLIYAVSSHKSDEDLTRVLATMQQLIDAGAHLNWINKNYQTALQLAILENQTEKANLLILAGADIEARDRNGCTPLFYAVRALGRYLPLVVLLIRAGADVNARNYYGQTVLMAALSDYYNFSAIEAMLQDMDEHALAGYQKMFDLLVSAGADLDERDDFGDCPRTLVERLKKRKILTIITN